MTRSSEMANKQKKYLLHLSDLHMESIQETEYQLIVEGERKHPLASEIHNDLITNISSNPPLALIVTGDITKNCKHGEFNNAIAFMKSLSSLFKIKDITKFAFVVPGNHDISWGEDYSDYTRENFDTFYKKLFNANLIPSIQKLDLVKQGVVLYGLNSCCRESWKNPGVGFVNNPQLIELAQDVQKCKLQYSDALKIAVIHHHLLPVCDYNLDESKGNTYSILTNAEQVLQVLSQLNFCMIIHGHRHHYNHAVYRKYLKSPSEANKIVSNPIAVIGSGTLCRENQTSNTMYNIITLVDQKPSSYYFSSQTRLSDHAQSNYFAMLDVPITITHYSEIIDRNEILTMALEADIGNEDVSKVFNLILDKCLKAAGIDYGFLAIYDKIIERIRIVSMSQKYPDGMRKRIVGDLYKIGQGITGHIFETEKFYKTDDVLNDPYFSQKHKDIYFEVTKSKISSCLAAPIFNVDNSVCAVINVVKPRDTVNDKNTYDESDAVLWKHLCNEISPAINILVQKEQDKNNEKDLELLTKIQEELDAYGSLKAKLKKIIKMIEDCFQLDIHEGEAIAFILQEARDSTSYYDFISDGFNRPLVYKKGEGLTGGLIEAAKSDVALEHLKGNESRLGNKTTGKCKAPHPKKEEMSLSFFGSPIKMGDDVIGALVMNTHTPEGGDYNSLDGLIKRYLRMLEVISHLVAYKIVEKLNEVHKESNKNK